MAFQQFIGQSEILNLSDLARVRLGYSFRSRLEPSKDGEVLVIQMKDLLDNNTVDCQNLIRIDSEVGFEHHYVEKNDLVFRSRGLSTTAAILRENLSQAVIAAPLIRIRITMPDRILPEYLNWYLNQKDAQIYFASMVSGTVQNMISKQALESLRIAVPSLKVQRQIVELAALCSKEQEINQTLSKKREQFISALLRRLAKGE